MYYKKSKKAKNLMKYSPLLLRKKQEEIKNIEAKANQRQSLYKVV